jgi:hypothetical protein
LKIDYLLPPYEKHNMRIESIVHRFWFVFEKTLERAQYSLPTDNFYTWKTYWVHQKCEKFQKKYK